MVGKVVVASVAALGLSMLVVIPALAGEPAADTPDTPDTAGGRYTLNKVSDGFVRLDTKTGEVALCSPRAVGWACQAAPEDRAAYESEIARLRGENAALKQSLLAHDLPLPSAAAPERPGDQPGAQPGAHDHDITIRLPDNADLDRAMAYVEGVWRRFVDAVAKAQRQLMNKS